MKLNAALFRALIAVAISSLGGCVTAVDVAKTSPQTIFVSTEKFDRDRQAILAMAGNYRVTFDFIETVSFVEGYALKERKRSGGNEIVRVLEDRGDYISLQHILVVGGDDKFPVKHWRQDWYFEPESVLVFVGGNAWKKRIVNTAGAKGKWSQIVYQVDDAPRYGALGAWTHDDGVSQWTPPAEWRPLPRRDATKRDDYHVVDAVNRHTITPFGWAHEQENTKLILSGDTQALVREVGVNTYRRSDAFEVGVGDDYWAATQEFWAGVRSEWRRVEAENDKFGLTIQGEPEELYNQILGLANYVVENDMSPSEALDEARAMISAYTTTEIGALSDRISTADPVPNGQ